MIWKRLEGNEYRWNVALKTFLAYPPCFGYDVSCVTDAIVVHQTKTKIEIQNY